MGTSLPIAPFSGEHIAQLSDAVSRVNQQMGRTLSEMQWDPFAEYLASSRININVRQVLKPGQQLLHAEGGETDGTDNKKPRLED